MKDNTERNKILSDPNLFEFASESLKKDKDFVLELNELCRENNQFSPFKFAAKSLKDDIDFVIRICTYSDEMYSCPSFSELEFASEIIKGNRYLVKYATIQNPLAFWYASEELSNDKDFILSFIGDTSSIAFVGASRTLQKDPIFIKKVLAKNGFVLRRFEKQFENSEFRDNKEMVLIAVTENGDALQFASPRLRKDSDVVLAAVRNNCASIEYAHKSLSSHAEIMALGEDWADTIGNWDMD